MHRNTFLFPKFSSSTPKRTNNYLNSNSLYLSNFTCEYPFVLNYTDNSCGLISECNVKNCKKCSFSNKCISCKRYFTLQNNNCYSTNCDLFGFCDYCDEYECIKCQRGYNLQYGLCQDNKTMPVQFYYILLIILGLIFILVLLFQCNKPLSYKNKSKSIKQKSINLSNIKTGQYVYESISEKDNTNMKNTYPQEYNYFIYNSTCVFCKKKGIFSLLICGCGLCIDHSDNINKVVLKCPVHKCLIIKRLIISKNNNKDNVLQIV